jgi:two-component sensor histidine kinase
MEATLNEKEFLMREVHHRIKNNLQMISSFLSLEATLFPAKNFDEIMQSCQSRIMSLSLIHYNLKYFPENENTDIKYY